MYVCVAEKCEVMVFFFVSFSSVVSIDNFPPLPGKNENEVFFKDVCMCKTKTIIDGFFRFLSIFSQAKQGNFKQNIALNNSGINFNESFKTRTQF